MATETVANVAWADLDSIREALFGIEALALLLQKAFESTKDETTGVHGTAYIIEQLARRAKEAAGL